MKKIFTLMAAAVMAFSAAAQTETATFGKDNVTSAKDELITCTGFTIAADYNPGGTSKVNVYDGDTGIKLRSNKGADANEFVFTVDEGCMITKLVMGMVVNDGAESFKLSGISIDGTPVADFAAVTVPNTGNADGAAIVNLENIKATKDIAFYFDYNGYEGKNRQVFVAGEVTYEKGVAGVETISIANENAPIYNLQGVQVDENYKGIVIKNGKKFINK